MKFGVLVFPGSNCDHDTYNVIAEIAHQPVTFLWHDSEDLQGVDAVLVPGGFAYGDYLRTGAIARFSPVMQAVQKFAAGGGLVLGICNGFQILAESGLLPGALMRNAGLKYICKQVHLRDGDDEQPVYQSADQGRGAADPDRAHGGQLLLHSGRLGSGWKQRIGSRFATATPAGEITTDANPNGSLSNIAGILNEGRNVLGMMPHPDRSSEKLLGSADGWKIFASMMEALATR